MRLFRTNLSKGRPRADPRPGELQQGFPAKQGDSRRRWGPLLTFALAVASVTTFAPEAHAEEPSKNQHAFGPHFPPSSLSKAVFDISKNEYGAYRYAPKAPKIGDRLANIHLPAVGGDFDLDTARKAGPVVVIFYRGFW